MACPTYDLISCSTCGCDKLRVVALGAIWCPKCGTIIFASEGSSHYDREESPRLVKCCRKFEKEGGIDGGFDGETPEEMWERLGIKESIRLPKNRKAKS